MMGGPLSKEGAMMEPARSPWVSPEMLPSLGSPATIESPFGATEILRRCAATTDGELELRSARSRSGD